MNLPPVSWFPLDGTEPEGHKDTKVTQRKETFGTDESGRGRH